MTDCAVHMIAAPTQTHTCLAEVLDQALEHCRVAVNLALGGRTQPVDIRAAVRQHADVVPAQTQQHASNKQSSDPRAGKANTKQPSQSTRCSRGCLFRSNARITRSRPFLSATQARREPTQRQNTPVVVLHHLFPLGQLSAALLTKVGLRHVLHETLDDPSLARLDVLTGAAKKGGADSTKMHSMHLASSSTAAAPGWQARLDVPPGLTSCWGVGQAAAPTAHTGFRASGAGSRRLHLAGRPPALTACW